VFAAIAGIASAALATSAATKAENLAPAAIGAQRYMES
jgi:hypothetical protein